MNAHASLRNTTGRRGETFVEFAFAFLLFLVLVLGIMELGRAMWTYTTLAQAARQGARYAMVHGSASPATADQIAAIVDANAIGVDASKLTVSTTWNPSNTRGATVKVKVTYPFQPVTGSLIWRGTVNLGATSQMIVGN